MRSTNQREVGLIFREYARRIHAKVLPTDPSFIRISIACGKVSIVFFNETEFSLNFFPVRNQIEQWCEHNYPSFVQLKTEGSQAGTQTLDPADPRTSIVLLEQQLLAKNGKITNGNGIQNDKLQTTSSTELTVYVVGVFGAIFALSLMIIWAVLKYTDDA